MDLKTKKSKLVRGQEAPEDDDQYDKIMKYNDFYMIEMCIRDSWYVVRSKIPTAWIPEWEMARVTIIKYRHRNWQWMERSMEKVRMHYQKKWHRIHRKNMKKD